MLLLGQILVLLTKLQRDFFYFSVVLSKKGWRRPQSSKNIIAVTSVSSATDQSNIPHSSIIYSHIRIHSSKAPVVGVGRVW
jgi:hypothetical protein